jgi:hypothetical protein
MLKENNLEFEPGIVACTCHPRYTGSISRRITVQTSLGINVEGLSQK